MNMTDNANKNFRKVQLEILKEFIAICEKLNLQYFAVGGTAIGAVRHQGYIPWDDDIDVGMLKEDYEHFIEEAPRLLPEHLFLQTANSDPSYYLCSYAKIRDSRTTFIESSVSHIKMNHGIYIDIFPCFYVPKNIIYRRLHYKLQKSYFSYLLHCTLRRDPSSLRGRFIHKIIEKIYSLPSIVRRKLDCLFKSVKQGERVIVPDCYWGIHGYPKQWFEETIKIPFENLEICLPKEYDKYLTASFGNYMQLPPIEQQCPHHYADVIATDRPYTEYV